MQGNCGARQTCLALCFYRAAQLSASVAMIVSWAGGGGWALKQRPPHIAVCAWRQIEIAAGAALTSRALFGG
eukprot:1009999-Pyramimonas_sp.AAC.1